MLANQTTSPESFLLSVEPTGRNNGVAPVDDGAEFSSTLDEQMARMPKPERPERPGHDATRSKQSESAQADSEVAGEEDDPLAAEKLLVEAVTEGEEPGDVELGLTIEEGGNPLPLEEQPVAVEVAIPLVAVKPGDAAASAEEAAAAPSLQSLLGGRGVPGQGRREEGVATLANAPRGERATADPLTTLTASSAADKSSLEQFPKRLLEQMVGERFAAGRQGEASLAKAGDQPAAKGIELPNVNLTPAAAAPAARPLAGQPLPQMVEVGHPMGQKGWDMALGKQVVWLANNRLQEAQIQLNPRHLGPIEVKVAVTQEQQATVQFTVQHTATREAVENALPRLKEMFAEQGLNLAQSDVSQQQSFAGQQGEGEGNGRGGRGADSGESSDGAEGGENRYLSRVEVGVDYYA